MPEWRKFRIPLVLASVFLLSLLAVGSLTAAPFRPTSVTISGTVFFDKNGNGLRDPDDGGIENVTVQLFDTATNGSEFNASAVTGLDGTYAFAGVPIADGYTVSHEVLPNYLPITASSVNLGIVETSRMADFGDTLRIYVTGAEFQDLNHDGGRAPREPGIAGIFVKVFDDPNQNGLVDLGELQLGSDVTDQYGYYAISDLTPGHRVIYTATQEVGGIEGTSVQLSLEGSEVGAAGVMLLNGVQQGRHAAEAAPGSDETPAVDGEVLVGFRAGASPEQIAAVAAAHGAYVKQRIGGQDYLLGVAPGAAAAVIAALRDDERGSVCGTEHRRSGRGRPQPRPGSAPQRHRLPGYPVQSLGAAAHQR